MPLREELQTVLRSAYALCALSLSLSAQTASRPAAPFVVPAWPYPAPQGAPPPLDSVTLHSVPNSTRQFTAAHVANPFDIADWHPESHAPAPRVVTNGRAPALMACGYCHYPDGRGRPENAALAGLPADYIVRQVQAIHEGARRPAWDKPLATFINMHRVADSVTPQELRAAAEYFAKVKLTRRSQVVERANIPRVVPNLGVYFKADSDGLTEALEHRLIEVPEHAERHELRDAMTPYVAYVPPGSIARGKRLATQATRATPKPCVSCHGPNLRGVAPAPPIAGQFPSYILRQLLAFRVGARTTDSASMMRDVTAALSLDDMIAVAAYVGSLKR